MDENGGQLGVVPTREALDLARERGYDLIEVAPTANPPVCKLMDYGKFKYELGRREREAHKKQKTTEVKGIRLRPGTDDHDLDVKSRRMLQFLKEGNKVKVTVIFRSREITHPEFARRSLEKLAEDAAEFATVEKAPSFEGRTMTMVMGPKSAAEKEKAALQAAKKAADAGALEAPKGDGAKPQPAEAAKPAEAAPAAEKPEAPEAKAAEPAEAAPAAEKPEAPEAKAAEPTADQAPETSPA